MHKRQLVFIALLFWFTNFAQEGKAIAIYTEGNNYLQFYIESVLSELKENGGEKYFKDITSINRFILENKVQSELINLILISKSAGQQIPADYSNLEIKKRRLIIDKLTSYEYLLVVNTNILGELIEFQFQLFNTTTFSDINTPLTSSNYTSEDIFINPKSETYKMQIRNALQRLFPKSNKRPQASLYLYDEVITNHDTLDIPINENVKLDASNSGDIDSKNIKYFYENRIDDDKKIQTAKKLDFSADSISQTINLPYIGEFPLRFFVSDYIQSSDTLNFVLKTFKRPSKISFIQNHSTLVQYQTFKKGFVNSKIANKPYFIIDKIDSSQLIISDKKLGIKLKAEDKTEPIDLQQYDNSYYSKLILKKNRQNKDTLYVYRIDSLGFLSNPSSIVLNKLNMSRGKVSLMSNLNLLNLRDSLYGETGISLTIGFSYLIKTRFETGFELNFIPKTSILDSEDEKNKPVDFPESLRIFSKVFLYNCYAQDRKLNPYLKFITGYRLAYTSKDNGELLTRDYFTAGAGFGMEYNIISSLKRSKINLEFSNRRILNKTIPYKTLTSLSLGMVFYL